MLLTHTACIFPDLLFERALTPGVSSRFLFLPWILAVFAILFV